MNLDLLLQLVVNGLIVGALYGVVAMCFVLIYKATRVVNFAQGELLLVPAWICFWLVTEWRLPFLWGFLLTLAFMWLFGMLVHVVVLRPLVGEPIVSVIMVTIGLSIFFQALLGWLFGVVTERFPAVFDSDTLAWGSIRVQSAYLMSFLISLLLLLGFYGFFRYSRMGLAMRATAFDQQAAESLGVPVKRVFALAWAISAAVSAVAGVVTGLVNGVSSALAAIGIKVFPAVIVGGLDSIPGAVVGGILIGLLENLAEFVDGQFLHVGNLYAIAPYYVLILILMIKPYGLFGTEDIERL
jgi:branched-chain amino acid transport system permease protein